MNSLQQEPSVAHILRDVDVLSSVSTLRRVFEACIGPSCNCHLVHNDVGGHVTVTSAATTLISASQMSSPVLRLLTSAVQNHITTFADGGATTATLSLLMTEHALKMSAELHRHQRRLVVDLFDVIADTATSYLTSKDCPVRCLLSIDSLTDLLRLLKGVLSTKPVCGMSHADIEHISSCMLNIVLTLLSPATFSQSLSNDGHFSTIVVLGHPVSKSYVQSGTLVEASYLPAYQTADQRQPHMAKDGLTVTLGRLDSALRHRLASQCGGHSDGEVAVAVFGTSLAGGGFHGDDDVTDDVIEASSDVVADQCVVDRLLATAQSVVNCGAKVCLCQKVVHPRVKRFLRGEGVLVFDRLGHQIARQLAWQTGAQLVSAPFTPVCADQLGQLDHILHQLINGKSYVCFEGGPQPAQTLILCAVTEAAASELQTVTQAAHRVLLRGLGERECLLGAGCWQRQLAEHLRGICKKELSERIGCRTVDVENVLDCVVSSLDRLAELIQPRSHLGNRSPLYGTGSSERRTDAEGLIRFETSWSAARRHVSPLARLQIDLVDQEQDFTRSEATSPTSKPHVALLSRPLVDPIGLSDLASSHDHLGHLLKPELSDCRASGHDLDKSDEESSTDEAPVLDLTSASVAGLRTAVLMTQSILKIQFQENFAS